ncbi:MAG: hypothetical protein KDD50_04145 [Bdellovibrionales bacterium]|nr:hypothetical protein [Bdellovibrionales bacterium]
MKVSFSIFIFLALFLVGCASGDIKSSSGTDYQPKEQVFSNYSYESIWRAVQISLSHYPIKVNNMDAGVIETDNISGSIVWTPAHRDSKLNSGLRYTIKVNVIKGRVKNKPVIKVTVHKSVKEQKDFFARSEDLPTDGLEEDTLLYRIKRELKIERAIERSNDN